MSDREDIWRHAKKYRATDPGCHRFARFLFVPVQDLSTEIKNKLAEADKKVLSLPCMRDKSKVFDVVYSRTKHSLGGPVEVIDRDDYLAFKLKDQT